MVRNAPSEALPLDTNSPSAKAALSYLTENVNLDSCGQQTKAYIDSILAGNPREIAAQVATAVYQQNHVAGVPLSPACLAAEVAWKNAVAVGQDPVLPSALAFMEASPSESPCYVSAKDYIQAIVGGSSHTEANRAAVRSFTEQITKLAGEGKSTIDAACLRSAQAYTASSGVPSSPNAVAMRTFIQNSVETGNSYDPVCAAASEAYIEAFINGATEAEATEAAATAFISALDENPEFEMSSPCGQAAQSYIDKF